jgi:predicted dehydrogenase
MKTASAFAAATGLPLWYADECLAQETPKIEPKGANDRVRVGWIGCGGQGNSDAGNAVGRPNVEIVAVCDVDTGHLNSAKRNYPNADAYSDFRKVLERKDIDAILCTTIDHWHTLITIGAMLSGKDVYCEKPLTFSIDESKRIVEVSKKTGRIVQTGTQQRSQQRFRLIADLVRNNVIGKVSRVDCFLPAGKRGGPFAQAQVPANFNYDFWMGQTPNIPYVKERTHTDFRYWWDYSGGTITDWGAHHNDIVFWCMDLDATVPVQVEGKPLIDTIPGGYTANAEYQLTWTYPTTGLVHNCHSTTDNDPFGGRVRNSDPNHVFQYNGVKFFGEDGKWLWVSRENQDASDPALLRTALPADAKRVYVSNNHMGNFIDCVRSRKDPICTAEVGAQSASLCHMGVLSVRLGRKLTWDPVKREFTGDAEANKYIVREMRKPYDYSFVGA